VGLKDEEYVVGLRMSSGNLVRKIDGKRLLLYQEDVDKGAHTGSRRAQREAASTMACDCRDPFLLF
jgi:hypothetical protein